jgi:ABC-type nitrate/sulfonate/bicarbonate transport system substrate-binding protein
MRKATPTAVVVSALLLAACGDESAAPSGDGTGPERDELVVGYNVTFDPTFLPDLASYECMKKIGVEPDVKIIKGAPASLTSLIAGEVDITLSTLGAGLNAVAQGQDIVAIVPSASAPYFTLMAPGDVEDWDDLEGLTFGSTSPSDSSYYTTVLLLEKHGVSPDDVKWVTVQGSAARAQAMVAGKIDAGQVTVTEMIEVEEQSDRRAFAVVGDDFPDLIFNAYWVQRDFLEQNRNLLRAFVDCLMTEHEEAYDRDLFMSKAAELLPDASYDDETLARAYDTLIEMNIWDPEESRWNAEAGDFTVETMADYGAVEKFIPFEDWADTSFVDELRDAPSSESPQ